MTALKAMLVLMAAAPVAASCCGRVEPEPGAKPGGDAARWPAARVVCLEYLGPTDRSLPPVLLAASRADIQRFLRAHAGNPAFVAARRVVASGDALDCAAGCIPGRPESAKDALLLIRVWTPEESYDIRVAGERGLDLMRSLQKCLAKDSAETASELNGIIAFLRSGLQKRS